MDNKRIVWADALRVFSIFCVVVLHVSGKGWIEYPVGAPQWAACNLFDGLTRFCVPAFVMLSGMQLLHPDKNPALPKRLIRIAAAYGFWSALYAAAGSLREGDASFWTRFLQGHYHLWFLFMIAGLYLVTPFLRAIAAEKKRCEYFLLLASVFALLLPTARKAGYPLAWFDQFQLQLVLGYSGYFVAGYYFAKYDFSKTARRVIYALGIAGAFVTVFGTFYLSVRAARAEDWLYSYFSPCVALSAVAVFTLFRQIRWRWNARLLERAARLVFGVYLSHDFFLSLLFRLTAGLPFYMTAPYIVLASLAVFLLALSLSFALSKIPLLKQYIL